jgi:hypothetical protein
LAEVAEPLRSSRNLELHAQPDKNDKIAIYIAKSMVASAQGPTALAIVASRMDVIELEISDSVELAAVD